MWHWFFLKLTPDYQVTLPLQWSLATSLWTVIPLYSADGTYAFCILTDIFLYNFFCEQIFSFVVMSRLALINKRKGDHFTFLIPPIVKLQLQTIISKRSLSFLCDNRSNWCCLSSMPSGTSNNPACDTGCEGHTPISTVNRLVRGATSEPGMWPKKVRDIRK